MKILTHVNMAPIESLEVLMRGLQDKQTSMWAFVSIEERIPIEHPLRRIKKLADQQLVKLSGVFNRMYSQVGRPSVAPERVLKSLLLMALYSVRSERQLCEQLRYNLLFRWFLDMELEEESFDATVFSKNRERLLEHEVGRLFFETVVKQAREANLISDEDAQFIAGQTRIVLRNCGVINPERIDEYIATGADSAALQSMGNILYWFQGRLAPTGMILFLIGAGCLYISFYRTRLIPRWLSVWGFIGVVLYMVSALLKFFNMDSGIGFYLEMVLAPQEMVMAAWLIVKGFNRSAIAALSAKTE
jgi:transposase